MKVWRRCVVYLTLEKDPGYIDVYTMYMNETDAASCSDLSARRWKLLGGERLEGINGSSPQ